MWRDDFVDFWGSVIIVVLLVCLFDWLFSTWVLT